MRVQKQAVVGCRDGLVQVIAVVQLRDPECQRRAAGLKPLGRPVRSEGLRQILPLIFGLGKVNVRLRDGPLQKVQPDRSVSRYAMPRWMCDREDVESSRIDAVSGGIASA